MTVNEIVNKLQSLGSEQTKKILLKHGAREPLFGVKIEDLKTIQKVEKGNMKLAMDLFSTGNYDAMYLAGLIADGAKMTTEELGRWANTAYGGAISEYTVPWVASENPAGYELAKTWIGSDVENIAVTGWSTFSSIVSVWPDERLDHRHLTSLLDRAEHDIPYSPQRVIYAMNGFLISVGCYVPELTEDCLARADKFKSVAVDVHGTKCKVPSAADYILKVKKMGRTGQKRKTAKC